MNNKFNVKKLAEETSDACSADSYTSWVNVVRLLDRRGFNVWEAEAILRSKITRWCRDGSTPERGGRSTYKALERYLDKNKVVPRCAEVNDLVMGTFENEGLELNEKGIPCRRGTMPGNYHPNKTILVPLGTPLSCDPTSETYWSM